MFNRLQNQLEANPPLSLYKVVLSNVLLSLTAFAFLFSDFRHGAFTFADYILILVMGIVLFSLQLQIKPNQIKVLIFVGLILLVNIGYSLYFNDTVSFNNLMTQSIKLLFYATTVIALYNYIDRNNLSHSFLTINKFVAFFSILIGLYITIAIYSDGLLPYEGLWHFTRRHPTSYEFQGNPNIIRTRSFFSEPAHFGYYLNIILASILFNVRNYKKKLSEITILIIGILLTMSFSMVVIMTVIIALFTLLQLKENGFKWKKEYYLVIGFFIFLIIIFWEFLFVTIILRTLNIMSGTDNSATNRMIESWQYVGEQSVIFGNGISHTPTITNNFAYIISDLGLIGFVPFLIAVLYMIYKNFPMGIVFVMLNFSRGGYLAAPFWLVLLFYYLYSIENDRDKIFRD